MSELPTIRRGGTYYRVVAPNWIDPANMAYSKERKGRGCAPPSEQQHSAVLGAASLTPRPSCACFLKERGGRWNPAGEFGALYLNATVQVAAANARAQHVGRAIKLFDLLPEARPQLVTFHIAPIKVLNACTTEGIAALGFPKNFPYAVPWQPCQAIARQAHAARLAGVAALSNAEATAVRSLGEELALFEHIVVGPPQARHPFQKWYPDPIPG